MSYQELTVDQAVAAIDAVPATIRSTVSALPTAASRQRPIAGAWSVAEYVCHLRDVYITYTIRLHRARTEVLPVLEPMLNDLRARRFRYNECNLNAVLDELVVCAAGFVEEIAHTRDYEWDRLATRLPREERSARWMVRQAAHEGQHHLADIGRIGEASIG
jgi:hypothetical protein